MQFDTIIVKPSPVHDKGVYVMHAEMRGFKYSGYFNDMPGFLTAVSDMGKFFALKMGKIAASQAVTTRTIQ